jgi:hypothetical protein
MAQPRDVFSDVQHLQQILLRYSVELNGDRMLILPEAATLKTDDRRRTRLLSIKDIVEAIYLHTERPDGRPRDPTQKADSWLRDR